MASMLPASEANKIFGWIHGGLDKAVFAKDIDSIMEKRCLACHDGSNPHIPHLGGTTTSWRPRNWMKGSIYLPW